MIDCRKVFESNHSEQAEKIRRNAETWFAFFDEDTPELRYFGRATNPIIARPTIRVGTATMLESPSGLVAYIIPIYDYSTCVALIVPDLAIWIDRGFFSQTTSKHMNELITYYEQQCPSMAKFRRLNVELVNGYRKEEEE